ncbi:ABC transporter [Sphingobium aromaticiconvertens]|uniref:ABC transporter n=1 Tax=Sphingobium aromaticiconvertens TaxID=365341 RepID=UPI00301A1ACD
MIAAARLFLMLFVPMLAVLLAGLFLVMRTGQVDPWLWGAPAFVFLAGAGIFAGRDVALASAVGAVLCVLLFCFLAAGRLPMGGAALGLLAISLLSGLGGAMLCVSALRGAAGMVLGCAALLLWLGPRDRVDVSAVRPSLAVMTALPLFWEEGGMARVDAPIIAVLRARFDVRAVDTLADVRAGDRLMLAQPRDPEPAGLVAIDAWVRAGGHVLVLADSRLVWPSRLPMGDRRRAPSVTALGPLLVHWGVELESVDEGEVRRFLRDGRLVTTVATGRLRAVGAGCRAMEDGLVMRCAVGRGVAVIVADADLLDDRLWLADPARPLEARNWVADTPDLMAQWLGLPMQAGRRWLRNGVVLRDAVCWALLAGIGWAVMGMAIGRAPKQVFGRLPIPEPPGQSG